MRQASNIMTDAVPLPTRRTNAVLRNRPLTPTIYELVLERNGMPFVPGQLVTLHGADDPTLDREYSICSAPRRGDELHLLYRVIPNGRLTVELQRLVAGQTIDVTGPHGAFTLRDRSRPIVFVATGTGLAPCLSYVRSYPALRATVLHGVRRREELVYRGEFASCRYIPCVSQEATDGPRYVTEALAALQLEPDAHVYLCGAYAMIVDAQAILTERGVSGACVFQEAYYYD